jgi:aspartate/methionine/tyrosine aminotransferase
MLEALAARGWTVEASQATFYIWCRVPDGDDLGLTERLMRVGLVVTPGSWLGPGGRGYVRWALVPTLSSCRTAAERLARFA